MTMFVAAFKYLWLVFLIPFRIMACMISVSFMVIVRERRKYFLCVKDDNSVMFDSGFYDRTVKIDSALQFWFLTVSGFGTFYSVED